MTLSIFSVAAETDRQTSRPTKPVYSSKPGQDRQASLLCVRAVLKVDYLKNVRPVYSRACRLSDKEIIFLLASSSSAIGVRCHVFFQRQIRFAAVLQRQVVSRGLFWCDGISAVVACGRSVVTAVVMLTRGSSRTSPSARLTLD